MANVNVVVVGGNLTRDPELRYSPNGVAVGSLSVAINDYRAKGDRDSVSFFDVVVFGKVAESCAEHLEKGRGVVVTGRLQQRRWEHDGTTRSKVEVVANSVEFL